MSWIYANPNPYGKEVPDCVIRAISIALNLDWYTVYDSLCALGREEGNIPIADSVWGKFLYQMGFIPFFLPHHCPSCLTIRQFCHDFSVGTFIIGTGSHAVAVIDGNYYDSWDSGNEIATFFWSMDR